MAEFAGQRVAFRREFPWEARPRLYGTLPLAVNKQRPGSVGEGSMA